MYLVKTPRWLRLLYPGCIWDVNTTEKVLYLTFDDGPHPVITPFVLNALKKVQAKATFFCIGNNVAKYPGIYQQILDEGHSVGNHTYNHVNAWKTSNEEYLDDVEKTKTIVKSNLFRPPFGRINGLLIKQLREKYSFKTIMWTVLSGDFDISVSPEKCLNNVVESSGPGSIIVFHDSEKAYDRLEFALPAVLDHFTAKDYTFERLNL